MRRIGVGIIGFGTVGTGVVSALLKRKKLLAKRGGFIPELKVVCDRDLTRRRKIRLPSGLLSDNPRSVLENPEVDIVAELIGGTEEAGSFILEAFQKGKSVVTANKALLAEKGELLLSAAAKYGCHFGFEGSVGGAIPIIRTIKESFVANHILRLYGILNGTTNFILTKMSEEKVTLSTALKEAQQRGFAEREPYLDLSGKDSSHKLSVLATLITGRFFPAKSILTEGIEKISPEDLRYAAELGYQVKLLSLFKAKPSRVINLATYPALIPKKHILSSVGGVANAIFMTGDLAGESLLFGQGAGMNPTASSVISDIVSIGRYILYGVPPTVNEPVAKAEAIEHNLESRYYFRFTVLDQPGVLAKIAEILGNAGISIASCIQKEERPKRAVPVVMLTHRAKEFSVREAIARIDQLPVVKAKTVLFRLALEG